MKQEVKRVPRSYKINRVIYEDAQNQADKDEVNLAQFVEFVVSLYSSGVTIKGHKKSSSGKRITWNIVEDLRNANAKP